MADEPMVQELLIEILASQRPPEEVCATCPELLPVVRKRLEQMRVVEAELLALFPTVHPDSGADDPASGRPGAELPRVPGYEVQAELGRGGMGVVYKARHLRLGRAVALKMLLAGAYASPDELARFQREAEAVAALHHVNVVQIYDVGDYEGQPYFTMEFVEGGSLAEKLAGTPLPVRPAAALVATLAGAVQAAHQGGILHRDLKPGNILLTADGTPKITDFGLARKLDQAGLTRTGTTLGTPSYMAPEQARGNPDAVAPAADLYALGAILYEMLTGRPPFCAETVAETLLQVLSQDPVPPSRLNASVPRDLETICCKCLHKEPKLRYSTAAAVADDLNRYLRGEAIAARPEGRLERLARRVRRKPVLSAALAASTLFAVALFGCGLWLISERAAAARKDEAERVATERAADEDLREMVRLLKESSWPEARAALERAKVRLGDRGSDALRCRLDQGARNLELARQLEKHHLDLDLVSFGGIAYAPRAAQGYEKTFREAGLGQVHDDAEAVAERIRASNIRTALVAALDHWSTTSTDQGRRSWLLNVARRADRDATGWRGRARDPDVRKHDGALARLIETAPVTDRNGSLLLAVGLLLRADSPEQERFLKRIQKAHPGDVWVNLKLGNVVFNMGKHKEAAGYFQAALALRPGAAIIHCSLGVALLATGRSEEALEHLRQAVDLDRPTSPFRSTLGLALSGLGRHDEAIKQLRMALRCQPNTSQLHKALGFSLEARGRHVEALAARRRAVELDPKDTDNQKELRAILMRQGRLDEARVAWQTALKANPPEHAAWYGYAEFCLFLGHQDDYRQARQALLARFAATVDPYIAERTARACLLLPTSGAELRQAVALGERAAAADRSKYRPSYPYFLFVQGLAEYRQGQFDRAIATMRGAASRVLGPAPRLVLAMALHRNGQAAQARKTLAAAVLAYDWRANQVRDQDGWIYHVLRREAERMMLPNMPAFLEGKHQPTDNDERLALLGVCQFTNRSVALARLYAEAFRAAPLLSEDIHSGHRFNAACAAALAGWGRGEEGARLSQQEQARWRKQARAWLRLDLAAWARKLASGATADRELVRQRLTAWQADPDMAGLREPGALEKLSGRERKEWLALWKEIDAVLKRTTAP
jgi:serine/threonine-protein kinase